jgi:NAD(P)-dependent dehydrogenase (short-subunit alcohol dehydrogenase family)
MLVDLATYRLILQVRNTYRTLARCFAPSGVMPITVFTCVTDSARPGAIPRRVRNILSRSHYRMTPDAFTTHTSVSRAAGLALTKALSRELACAPWSSTIICSSARLGLSG